ncbi:hypothetical protein BLNAU_18135 [Blattamonas nauphoetae]|uniref:Right handed beta helix domain-containing protein n=1 Tax=Blattamonas nauphoetae TaxID=2049346 RepID=A0ABQ9X555_9EUKA|nr:hypothetical protein BLNAU_18135 [Blattamonas nauphoetae]
MQLIFFLCRILCCFDEHYQDFDAVYKTKITETYSAPNSELMCISFDTGLYSTNSIEIVSKSVELHGNKTGLSHRAALQNQPSRIDEETANGRPRKDTNVERWMMEARNSSVTMRSFRLDAGMAGTSICVVVESSVEVIDSEILSNMKCSGFVLTDSVGSGSSKIVIVGSNHKSSTPNVVLPLVGTGYGQLNLKSEEWMVDEGGSNEGWEEREEIVGVELSFVSTHFALGTGPLFSFARKSLPEGDDIEMVGEISTELRLSSISNVTSSYGDEMGKKMGVGSCVWERVVGSRIERSTNHDSGTGLCGTRLGGNVICANSSFSSCVRTSNDEIDMEHKNITTDDTGRTRVISSSGMTSVKFTFCTFNDLTVSPGAGEGGAISLSESASTLTVSQCFFHKCICTHNYNIGGAICMIETRSDCPVTISSCSFSECAIIGKFGGGGGSVYCTTNSTVSVSDSFFEKSKAHLVFGAVKLEYHPLATLSNCAFVSCSANESGGALGIHSVKSIDFSFLQF